MPITTLPKLAPAWTVTAAPPEVIWKLLIAPNGILTGEERNPESKEASLFAFDLKSDTLLWRGKKLQEPWWFSSEKATREVLLIQTFQSPNLPESKGIFALDLATGRDLWQAPQLSLLFATDDICFASKVQYGIQSYLELDIRTGETLREYGSDWSAMQSRINEGAEIDPHSFFVQSVMPEDANFARVVDLVGSALNLENLRGVIEYLKFGRYLIVSFHVRVIDDPVAALEGLLKNMLIVIDTESAEVIFRETLQSRTPLPVPDSFFVSHHTLLYVKEKHTLTGIRLD